MSAKTTPTIEQVAAWAREIRAVEQDAGMSRVDFIKPIWYTLRRFAEIAYAAGQADKIKEKA